MNFEMNILLGAALLAVIGGGFMIYGQRRKKKMVVERQKLLQRQERTRRMEAQQENELKQYITDTLNKGFTQDQIRKKLVETGWNPAVADRNINAALPKQSIHPPRLRPFALIEKEKKEEREKAFTQFEEKKEAEEEIKPLPLKEEKAEKPEEKGESFEKLNELTKERSPFGRLLKLKIKSETEVI